MNKNITFLHPILIVKKLANKISTMKSAKCTTFFFNSFCRFFQDNGAKNISWGMWLFLNKIKGKRPLKKKPVLYYDG